MTARPTQRSASRGAVTGQFLSRSPMIGGGTEFRSYKGAVTTTGKSGAVRFEKQFFTNHPEFALSARVTARTVAPGFVLIAVDVPEAVGDKRDELDPMVGAFLSFMEADLKANPHKVQPLDITRLAKLVEGVEPMRDDEELPEDFAL